MPSIALVLVQFAALGVVMWRWDAVQFRAAGWLPIALAIAIAGWSILHNRPGNFSVLPEPRDGARLITSGPYARVRHPMYSAVMLFVLGCALGWNTFVHWLAAGVLVAVLQLKARREERLLALRFAAYESYAARTPRFLPAPGGRRGGAG